MRALRRPSIAPQVPLLGAFVVTSVLNYAFSLAASRVLSPGDFGLLAFGQTLLLLGGFILQSGVPWSLARAVVVAKSDRRGGLFRGALLANVAVGAGLALAVVAMYVTGPLRGGLEQPAVVASVAVALPLIAITAVARAGAQGLHRFGIMALVQALEVGVKVVAGIGLAVAGLGALGAVSGFAVGAFVASAVGLVLVFAAARFAPLGERHMPEISSVGPMFGALLGLSLVLNIDLIAVKLLITDRAVAGQYQAAIILANAPYFLVSSALVPILFNRLASRPSLRQTRRSVAQALSLAVAIVLPVEMLLIAVPHEVLALFFPPAYAGAAPILRLMAVGNAALIVVVVLGTAFQAVGRAWEMGRIILGVVAVEAVALFLVVPRFGQIGAVSSFVSASVACAVVLAWRYATEARVDLRAALRWLARFGAAVAAGLALALLCRSIGGVAAGVAVGAVVYYVLVVRLRLVPAAALHLPVAEVPQ